MKALIISDIHSNIHALEAIWSQERDSDLIYCTGDLVDYGPFPKEVLDWARAHDLVCTQGNHDSWVVKCWQDGQTLENVPAGDRAWVHHNAALLDAGDIRYLEGLPTAVSFELNNIAYGMTHLFQEYEEIVSLYEFEQFRSKTFPNTTFGPVNRLILGHTHRQAVRYLSDDLLWLNPGSAAYRRRDDPDQSAHYATITDGAISLKRLDYDLQPLRRALEQVELKDFEMPVRAALFWDTLTASTSCWR